MMSGLTRLEMRPAIGKFPMPVEYAGRAAVDGQHVAQIRAALTDFKQSRQRRCVDNRQYCLTVLQAKFKCIRPEQDGHRHRHCRRLVTGNVRDGGFCTLRQDDGDPGKAPHLQSAKEIG